MVDFYRGRFKKPIHVVFNVSVCKGWLLGLFYGFGFWPIFDFSRNDSKIHPLTIRILLSSFLNVIRYVLIIIMPFYGVFVTFRNLDFRELFWLYWKRDEPHFTFDGAKSSSITPTKIYKVIWRSWYRTTCP